MGKKSWLDEHHVLSVTLAGIVLTLIFTYPAAFHLNDALIGPQEDNQQNYWVLWHIQQAVFGSAELYTTDMLYHPQGASLAVHTLDLMDSLFFAVPLQQVFSLITTYNLLILLGFVLAFLGMYLLALYLTSNKLASVLAAIIFAFSPYHTAHAMHHLNLASIQFIPFFVLYLLKLLDTPTWKHALLAAVFLTMLSLDSWYYLVYMVLFAVLYLIWKIAVTDKGVIKLRAIKFALLSTGMFALLIIPFIIPVARASIDAERLSNLWGQELFVTDLLAPITPPALHTLSQLNDHALSRIYFAFTGNAWETTQFFGYLVIVLTLLALIKLPFATIGFWGLTGLLYLALSFGPKLHILGKPLQGTWPYALFAKIPLLNLARIPSRFAVVTMLCLAVLVAYAFVWLSGHWKDKTWKNISLSTILFALFAFTILFEFSIIPLPVTPLEVPAFYQELAQDPEQYTLMEVPVFDWRGNDEYMFLQTIHNKKLLFGALSHFPKEDLDYLQYPIFKIMALPKQYLPKYENTDTSILQEYGVGYIIVHPEYFKDKQDLLLIQEYLDKNFNKHVQLDPSIIVYKVQA